MIDGKIDKMQPLLEQLHYYFLKGILPRKIYARLLEQVLEKSKELGIEPQNIMPSMIKMNYTEFN